MHAHIPSSSTSRFVKMGGRLVDIEKHFAFYGAYHSNPINVMIHVICVWPIFFSALLFLAFTSPLCPFPLPSGLVPFQQFMVMNWSFAGASVYALFYAALDRKAGSLAAFLCLACWIGSNALAQRLGFSLGWKVVLVSQLLCWTIQFIGHGVFEQRSPALLDNLFQALIMAPFFVVLEVLQIVFNYEPYPGFRRNVRTNVEANITAWREKSSSHKRR
ncbi:hypothetical protein L7F22_007260 [Adiantum nelumboides]|nr:hypothetical protein [Adiantum nelumboides]